MGDNIDAALEQMVLQAMSTTDSLSPRVFQYQQVADQLRRQIRKGILKPGDRLPSMREMRERYGVNFNTMEKVHALLDEEGLIIREQRKGAFVAVPQSRARTRTGVIGFCGIDLAEAAASPYWSPILAGAKQAMQGHDMQIMLLDAETRSGWEKIDGLLFNTAWYHDRLNDVPEMLPRVYLLMPPSAMEDGHAGEDADSGVIFDNYGGLRQSTEHLISLGHRRIAFLHSNRPGLFLHQRIAGYKDALESAGIGLEEGWLRRMRPPVPKYDFREVGAANMKLWLETDWKELGCTAVIAQNDSAAIGIIEELRAAGYRVPEDVSVVGFDGVAANEYSRPRLTTVKIPLFEVGQAAMELLMKQIESEESKPECLTLPVGMSIQESTAAVRS